ncbi:MAG: tetratricopeptide repeat protein [Betaproteobacteria bacterium]|nr:tetratricopeptide repeat protein [Betaproteobacteria bacterium]MDH3438990.1 tetratricopeptide repeat protein [Betaproteobacteria bacterium]
MAYDHEDQEQLDELKAWWKQHGKLVILLVAAFFASIAAFQGWRYYRDTQAVAAVTLYGQLEQADHAGDGKKARAIAAQIVDTYGSTTYAVLASLVAARHAFAGGDLAEAKARLQWVTEHAREEEVRDVARLRLAAVLLDEKNYADALKLVETKPGDGMAGLYADLRGDILLAQGKTPEARSAYQFALDKSQANNPYRATLQLKLDSLGEAR